MDRIRLPKLALQYQPSGRRDIGRVDEGGKIKNICRFIGTGLIHLRHVHDDDDDDEEDDDDDDDDIRI
jgi:hypothetical protein